MADINEKDILKHYKWLAHKQETELRVITPQGNAFSVFVHSEEELLKVCRQHSGKNNIYLGVNERRRGGTKISDIKFINNFYIDIDNKGDFSKTQETAVKIKENAVVQGYQEPLFTCSGGGFHLYFALEPIENTEENRKKIKNFGMKIKEKYEGKDCLIDEVVFEPARIMRLAGCMNIRRKVIAFIINPNVKRILNKKLTQDILNIEIPKREFTGEKKIVGKCAFLDYCLTHKITVGARHKNISPEIAKYIKDKPDREALKQQWLTVQEKPHYDLNQWLKKLDSGEYENKGIFCANLINFQKKNNIALQCRDCPEFKRYKRGKHDEEKQERIKAQYIFDEDKILKNRIFTLGKINNEIFAFGLLLPKEIDLKDKKGNIIGKDQFFGPVLITSNPSLLEMTKETELKYKIKIATIPSVLHLRWGLASIKEYLDKKAKIVDGFELFNKIKRNGYERFLFFRNKNWYNVHPLWDIGTYFFELFSVYPLMEMRGLAETAKSKVMKVSRLMTLNPTDIMINPSEATLFRETHNKTPTKYLDEAEKLFRYNKNARNIEPDNRAELINGSYNKGSYVPRQEKIFGKYVTVYYRCYSPTMISSIRGLFGATETRAITHIMTKALDTDPRGELEVENSEEEPIWQEIRNDIYLFALQNWKKVEEEYQSFNEETSIKKRDLQLWKPLLVLAKIINHNLFLETKEFAEKVSHQRRSDFIPEGSFNFKILEATKKVLDIGESKIYVKNIRKKYKELFSNDELTPGFNRKLSSQLDHFGFKEMRGKDREGAFFDIPQDVWEVIVAPICPDLSSQSSQSSHLRINNIKTGDEQVTNCDEKIKNNVTNVTKSDENDDYSKRRRLGWELTPEKNPK